MRHFLMEIHRAGQRHIPYGLLQLQWFAMDQVHRRRHIKIVGRTFRPQDLHIGLQHKEFLLKQLIP